MIRLVIFVLRRVLMGMITIVVMTLFGGGRLARRVLRIIGLVRRIVRF
jgi:hypothetical protein